MRVFLNRIAVLIITLCVFLTGAQSFSAVAAESENEKTASGVIEDLSKDASFNAANYPSNAKDYSLSVMQVAESTDKELFIYVYQPSGDKVRASSINISTTINDEISFFNYPLKLLNFEGTLFKYKVTNFEVKKDPVRYYAISSVYRPYNSDIDNNKSGNNTINEVNYAVNRQYCFGEINGKPYVNCVDIETIVVTDKFVGFVRYPDGFNIFHPIGACDSHFVAFNTDRKMGKLFEADVYYTTQKVAMDYFKEENPFKTDFGESKTDNYAYLKYTDKVEHTGGGLFAGTYKWDRIQTVDDFIYAEDRETIYSGAIINSNVSSKLTDEALSELKGKKWVLRFTETDYTKSSKSGMGATTYYHSESTIVGDVTILRLKFEADGIAYNLGVIDNKQTGGKEPSNETDIDISLNKRGKMILYLLMLILLIILLAPLLPYVLNAIIFIVSLSIKLVSEILKLIKSSKEKRKERKEKNEKD